MINIKTEPELVAMRKAGSILKDVLSLAQDNAKVGVSTKRLDALAYEYIKKQNAIPSCLGYNGFPATLCTSIDEQVVHGIPSSKVLEEGMLLKIDVCVTYNGLIADGARTFAIGKVSPLKQKLMEVAKQSFFEGIKHIKSGNRLGDMSHAIQTFVEANGFSVVRDLVGHGIGRKIHEDPTVPNYGAKGRGIRLLKNMTLAIEPMINAGGHKISHSSDGWTVVTADKSPSAHYENTVIVKDGDAEIITE
jgi:methionyl aminopeptidase